MQHTKGEWNISKTVNDYVIYAGDSPSDIAMVYQSSRPIPAEEAEANVKIMAAAPELLEALEFALVIIDRLSEDYATIAGKHANFTKGEFNKIDRAIQKATT